MAKFLPSTDRAYLDEKGYAYDEVEEGGLKGLIIKAFAVPGGRLEPTAANVLIFLPQGYPDVAPDMFHTDPWLKLVPQGGHPKAADQPVKFADISWQRWSRHNSEWRAGIDGIQTMLARVVNAMQTAAP
jgi:hypothetical protein